METFTQPKITGYYRKVIRDGAPRRSELNVELKEIA